MEDDRKGSMMGRRFFTKGYFLVPALVLLLALAPAAASGQSAAPFTRMGFGARGIALGNALVADAFGQGSAYYNPALAPYAERQSLSGTVAILSHDRRLEFLQFATPLEPRAGIAAGVIHASVSEIDGRDNSGYHTDYYSTNEFAFFLGFGIQVVDNVSIGTNVQVYRSDYFDGLDPVIGLGIDVGTLWQASDRLQVGLAIEDLLAQYAWDTSSIYGQQGRTNTDNFPRRLRLGTAYAFPNQQIRLFAEAAAGIRTAEERRPVVDTFQGEPIETIESEDRSRVDARLRFGAEYGIAEPLTLRAGIDRVGAQPAGQAVPSAGFMIAHDIGQLSLEADYALAFTPYAGDAMHFIALRMFL